MKEGKGFLARIIPATRILQALVGQGDLDNKKINKAEMKLEKNISRLKSESSKYLRLHLNEIEKLIAQSKRGNADHSELIGKISLSLANFCGNTSLLTDTPVHKISNVVFLSAESIKTIDDEFIELLEGYSQNLEAIFFNENISGESISLFEKEMEKACKRYFNSKNMKIANKVDNSENILALNMTDNDD